MSNIFTNLGYVYLSVGSVGLLSLLGLSRLGYLGKNKIILRDRINGNKSNKYYSKIANYNFIFFNIYGYCKNTNIGLYGPSTFDKTIGISLNPMTIVHYNVKNEKYRYDNWTPPF